MICQFLKMHLYLFILSLVLFEKLDMYIYFQNSTKTPHGLHGLSVDSMWIPHGVLKNFFIQNGNSDMVEWSPPGVHGLQVESMWTCGGVRHTASHCDHT